MSAQMPPRGPIRRDALSLGVVLLMLGLAGTSGLAQSVPSHLVTMRDLTIPNDRLPNGCNLKVIESGRQALSVTPVQARQGIRIVGPITAWMQPTGVTVNPWTGTDRRILAELREGVDGHVALRLPDAPPLTNSERSALLLRFADGVEEGYAATYAQTGSRDLGVWAVKFTRAPDMQVDLPGDGHSHQNALVVTIGSIRAALFGDGGACSAAIETYLKSLGK